MQESGSKNIINFILRNHRFSGKKLEGKSKKEVYHRSEREIEKLKTTLATNLERTSARRVTDEKGGKEIIHFATKTSLTPRKRGMIWQGERDLSVYGLGTTRIREEKPSN